MSIKITKGSNSIRIGPSPLLFIITIHPLDMNVYARFDEISSLTFQDIKETLSKPIKNYKGE